VAVNAFSVPIMDAQGHLLMTLSLTTQADRMSPDWDGPVPRALVQAARELSDRL
jgi:DNA-binding IclR family transcriptional regulator